MSEMTDARAVEVLAAMREDGGVVADADYTAAIDRAVARLREPVGVGGEWVLVPREPSAAMWDSAENAMIESECAYNAGEQDARSDAHEFPTMRIWQAVVGYRAMLAAAPQPPAKVQAQGGGEVVERALEYLHPHLAANDAAPAWAIHLASILTGGDGCGAPAPPSAPVGAEGYDLAVLDDAAETLDRLGDGSTGLREARARIASALSQKPEAVDEVVRAAVLAEREACAKACDDRAAYYHAGDDDGPKTRRGIACEACASVIRKRSTVSPKFMAKHADGGA